MKIIGFDHLVLTTGNLANCLTFYSTVLGMAVVHENERYALQFGQQKINIHTNAAEFLPAANNPQVGSLDICLVATDPIDNVYKELAGKGMALETGIVERNGAKGVMKSVYLRDPDGNLIEICSYSE